ncbi:hypothetical protein ACMD2_09417 [Ananas comosus]|uniref:Secreted protein n=1 Tax=Ananas comosus TaxID=4615 RepID=A0A199W6W4_ANACO|nr:hypothetical protein ACMD2_09417 [Ananas comosus]
MMSRHRRSIFFLVIPSAIVLCLLLSGLSPVYADDDACPVCVDPYGPPTTFTPVPDPQPPDPPSTRPYWAPPRQQKP